LDVLLACRFFSEGACLYISYSGTAIQKHAVVPLGNK